MCFMMDPIYGKKMHVQFPQRFDGIDRNDRYSNRNIVFFDVRCVFRRRQALYGFDSPPRRKPPAKTAIVGQNGAFFACCRSRKKNEENVTKEGEQENAPCW
ncbi:hypothetical protein IFM89_030678, partial [Coptis chinensis]